MRQIALAATVALSLAGVAAAQELIVGTSPMPTPPDPAPAEAIPDPEAKANGDWARKVMADAAEGKSSKKDDQQAQAGCVRNPDRKPHGEVWGTVGTGGYKGGGIVVTQPVGDCGSVTVGYEQSHGDRGRRWR